MIVTGTVILITLIAGAVASEAIYKNQTGSYTPVTQSVVNWYEKRKRSEVSMSNSLIDFLELYRELYTQQKVILRPQLSLDGTIQFFQHSRAFAVKEIPAIRLRTQSRLSQRNIFTTRNSDVSNVMSFMTLTNLSGVKYHTPGYIVKNSLCFNPCVSSPKIPGGLEDSVVSRMSKLLSRVPWKTSLAIATAVATMDFVPIKEGEYFSDGS